MTRKRIEQLQRIIASGGIKTGHAIEMLNEIEFLRGWVEQEAAITNVCTYNALREICAGCKCNRAKNNSEAI